MVNPPLLLHNLSVLVTLLDLNISELTHIECYRMGKKQGIVDS